MSARGWQDPEDDEYCMHRTDTYSIEPVGIQGSLPIRCLGDLHSPFASILTLGIFPLWFNPFFEELQVCAWSQPAGRLDVVV